tara:strand:+ start:118230 stop:119186 length:957 start_codon:yes stop_codon:yes gene_type:complete
MKSIKDVSMVTGISVHTLRAWEKRYGVVNPNRSENGRRYYSEADIEKLELLSFVVKAGEAIGQVQKLSLEELKLKAESLEEVVLKEEEKRDYLISQTVLLSALKHGIKDIILHELQSVVLKLNKNESSIKRLVKMVIIPFSQELSMMNQSSDNRSKEFANSITQYFTNILKQVVSSAEEVYGSSNSSELNNSINNKKILIGNVGSEYSEIDALMCVIQAYLNGREALYVGKVLDQETIKVFTESEDKFDLLLVNRPETANTCTMLANIISGIFDKGRLAGDLAVFQRDGLGKCFGQPWGYSFKTLPDHDQVEEFFAAS